MAIDLLVIDGVEALQLGSKRLNALTLQSLGEAATQLLIGVGQIIHTLTKCLNIESRATHSNHRIVLLEEFLKSHKSLNLILSAVEVVGQLV